MPLRTDYTNDILDTSKNTERVYNLKNASGEIVEENIRIEDITEYSQEGSKFGANDINATNQVVNRLEGNVNNINLYVGTDNKLHFVNKDGADSVLPFSKKLEIATSKETVRSNWNSHTTVTVPEDGDYILFTYFVADESGDFSINEPTTSSSTIEMTVMMTKDYRGHEGKVEMHLIKNAKKGDTIDRYARTSVNTLTLSTYMCLIG